MIRVHWASRPGHGGMRLSLPLPYHSPQPTFPLLIDVAEKNAEVVPSGRLTELMTGERDVQMRHFLASPSPTPTHSRTDDISDICVSFGDSEASVFPHRPN